MICNIDVLQIQKKNDFDSREREKKLEDED